MDDLDVSAREYNKGTLDDRKKALDSIYDYNKTLITLATGTVALSATFLATSLYHGVSLDWLIASWIVLVVSIFVGLLGLGAYISQYAESKVAPRHSAVELWSLFQIVSLLAGLGCLGKFAVDNATHKVTTAAAAAAATATVPLNDLAIVVRCNPQRMSREVHHAPHQRGVSARELQGPERHDGVHTTPPKGDKEGTHPFTICWSHDA